MKRLSSFVLLALLVGAAPAAAQSLFATRGLGVPIAPVDARARALGGIGVGLFGANPSLINPAAAAGVVRRGIVAAIQPSSRSMEFEGAAASADATRFPLIGVAYPFGMRLVATIGYGGFLDQSWAVVTEGTEAIGGTVLETRDVIESSGGLAQLRVGVAYALTPSFAVGIAGGLYTGNLAREISRSFPDPSLAGIADFRTRASWSYRAPLASAGIRWDLASLLRLGASITWGGELDARLEEGLGGDQRFDLPLQAAAGASAYLSPRVLAAVAGRWTGWSVAADDFEEAGIARDVWEIGGGLEWAGGSMGTRSFPVRVGFNYNQLPFTMQGEAPAEWSAALGLGVRFNLDEFGPLATADASLERGGRGNAATTGLTEDFWRFTFSLALFGR